MFTANTVHIQRECEHWYSTLPSEVNTKFVTIIMYTNTKLRSKIKLLKSQCLSNFY